MEIPLYLALTAAEFQAANVFPNPLAWMACHFSSYGTGLSNVPNTLPPGSMLMLNDRTPIGGHDPQLVAQTLCKAAKELKCDRILLDFQRPEYPEIPEVIEAVLKQADCPVGVSSLYADGFDCAVLIPPIAPHTLPKDALTPWKDRELWLELSNTETEIKVTKDGSQYTPLPRDPQEPKDHQEPELFCHYRILVEDDQVLFQLGRTKEDQEALLAAVQELGVSCAVGLWQETSRQ